MERPIWKPEDTVLDLRCPSCHAKNYVYLVYSGGTLKEGRKKKENAIRFKCTYCRYRGYVHKDQSNRVYVTKRRHPFGE